MGRGSLEEIYGASNDYNEIKVRNLKSECTNSNSELAIKNLACEIRRKCIGGFIIAFIINILTFILLYELIRSGDNLFTKEFFFIIIVCILFLYPTFDIGNIIYSTRNGSYKKAQYGVVKTKFYENKIVNKKVKRKYYVNVIFPINNTLIKKVNCNESIYNLISDGGKVLVVSFDNKSAHIVLL